MCEQGWLWAFGTSNWGHETIRNKMCKSEGHPCIVDNQYTNARLPNLLCLRFRKMAYLIESPILWKPIKAILPNKMYRGLCI